MFNFAVAYRLRSPDMGEVAGAMMPWFKAVAKTYMSVYPTLVLDRPKSGSFKVTVKDEVTIGTFWYDIPVRSM